jgi:hypothetical protein
MSRLGHATPQAAMRYQHVAQGRDEQIAEALSNNWPTADMARGQWADYLAQGTVAAWKKHSVRQRQSDVY